MTTLSQFSLTPFLWFFYHRSTYIIYYICVHVFVVCVWFDCPHHQNISTRGQGFCWIHMFTPSSYIRWGRRAWIFMLWQWPVTIPAVLEREWDVRQGSSPPMLGKGARGGGGDLVQHSVPCWSHSVDQRRKESVWKQRDKLETPGREWLSRLGWWESLGNKGTEVGPHRGSSWIVRSYPFSPGTMREACKWRLGLCC